MTSPHDKRKEVVSSIPKRNLVRAEQVFLTKLKDVTANQVLSILSKRELVKNCDIDRAEMKLIQEEFSEDKLPEWWNPQIEAKFTVLERISLEDAFNYIVFRFKFHHYPRTGQVYDFPQYVLIEPVSSCNLRCPMCFQVDSTFTKKPYMGIMNLNLFKKVINECAAGGTGAITLASRGEPTLHPKLPEMLSYLNGKFFEVKLITNGTRLNEDLCRSIFKNGIDQIVLSIDSEDPEIFESIRYGADFQTVLKNVIMLKSIREREFPNSMTRIRISGVKIIKSQNPTAFKEFWSQYVDEVTMGGAEERWDTYNNQLHPELTDKCLYPWERLYVWFDGTCNPCDVDYKSFLSPGKIGESSIRKIWHSNHFKKLRSDHLSGERGKHNPCDRCQVC